MADNDNNSNGELPEGVTPITNEVAALMLAVEKERADKDAIISEFRNAPTTEAYEKVKELFSDNVIAAAESVVHLSQYAEAESLRLSASRYVIDTYLGKGKMSGDDAAMDFAKFMKSLKSEAEVTAEAEAESEAQD